MQYLILSILVYAAAVSARVYPGMPFGGNPYVPSMPQIGFTNGLSTGRGYFDQGYSGGSSGAGGSGYQLQDLSSYYNQGQNHNRVKQVLERENSSNYNMGGVNQGSSFGQFGRRFDTFGNGHLRSGDGFLQTSNGYFV